MMRAQEDFHLLIFVFIVLSIFEIFISVPTLSQIINDFNFQQFYGKLNSFVNSYFASSLIDFTYFLMSLTSWNLEVNFKALKNCSTF